MAFNWKALASVGTNLGISILQGQGGKAATVGNVIAASMATIQNISNSIATPLTGDQKAALVLQTVLDAVHAEAAAVGKSVTIDPVLIQNAISAIAAVENNVAQQLHG